MPAPRERCAGILMRDEKGRYLLLFHRREGLWVAPGGHAKSGESNADAARREAWEEARARPS